MSQQLVAVHLVPKREFQSDATCCSLKHHSKRVTSLIGVITGDIAIFINIGWTSVTARERIVVEMQLSYEEKTNQENIHEGTLNEEKDNDNRPLTNSLKLTRLLISDGIVPVNLFSIRLRRAAQTFQTNH
jgi:hypothetical protein